MRSERVGGCYVDTLVDMAQCHLVQAPYTATPLATCECASCTFVLLFDVHVECKHAQEVILRCIEAKRDQK